MSAPSSFGLVAVLALVACHGGSETAGSKDTARAPDTAAAGDSGDSADSGADTAPDYHSCEDLPWESVQVGYGVACGIHVGGCVECWDDATWHVPGVWPSGGVHIMDEPDSIAVELTLNEGWHSDSSGADRPFACIITAGGRLECWGSPPRDMQIPDVPGVVDAQIGESALAVLDEGGVLWIVDTHGDIGGQYEVRGPITFSSFWTCGVQDDALRCWTIDPKDGVNDLGPSESWLARADSNQELLAVAADQSLWLIRVNVPELTRSAQIQPPGSPWVFAKYSGDYTVALDAAGYAYGLDCNLGGCDGDPVLLFSEPLAQVDTAASSICGVTQSGLLACIGTVMEEFPPPGSYVLEE